MWVSLRKRVPRTDEGDAVTDWPSRDRVEPPDAARPADGAEHAGRPEAEPRRAAPSARPDARLDARAADAAEHPRTAHPRLTD